MGASVLAARNWCVENFYVLYITETCKNLASCSSQGATKILIQIAKIIVKCTMAIATDYYKAKALLPGEAKKRQKAVSVNLH